MRRAIGMGFGGMRVGFGKEGRGRGALRETMSRLSLRGLLRAESELLRDMGLERGEVEEALHLPLSEDAGLWLESRRHARAPRG